MNRIAKSRIDVVRHDIIECNIAFNRVAYDYGKVLLMKYAMDIPGMQMQRYIFDEPYSQYRDRDYNSSILAFQDMLRKYEADLKDDVNDLRKELEDSKETNKKNDRKIQSIMADIADKKKELEASASEIERYKAQIRTYEDAARRARQELDDQRRERKNLQAELLKPDRIVRK